MTEPYTTILFVIKHLRVDRREVYRLVFLGYFFGVKAVKRTAKLSHILLSVGCRHVHALHDGIGDSLIHRNAVIGDGHKRFVHASSESIDGNVTRNHAVHCSADAVNVGPGSLSFAEALFERRITELAVVNLSSSVVKLLCRTEINHLDTSVRVKHYVLGRNITMNQSGFMNLLHGADNGLHHGERLFYR